MLTSAFRTHVAPSLLLLLYCSIRSYACPLGCYCFEGDFVSCYITEGEIFLQLPANTSSLLVTRGKFETFPAEFLRRIPHLKTLDIQFVEVDVIKNGTFSGVNGLELVAFEDCKIGTIQEGAFQDWHHVSEISFTSSEIGTISTGAFSNLALRGTFSISNNSIQRIETGAFSGLSDIKEFHFYLNNVTIMAENAFLNVRNLEKAGVFLNEIESLGTGTLSHVSEAASIVNMSSNTLPCQCAILEMFLQFSQTKWLFTTRCFHNETDESSDAIPANLKYFYDNKECNLGNTSLVENSAPPQIFATPNPGTFQSTTNKSSDTLTTVPTTTYALENSYVESDLVTVYRTSQSSTSVIVTSPGTAHFTSDKPADSLASLVSQSRDVVGFVCALAVIMASGDFRCQG